MKYNVKEAIKEIKDKSQENFVASVEIHINLDLEKDQNIRFNIVLPHGTGKTKKIAVLASQKIEDADLNLVESDIQKIEKGEIVAKRDFDILITEPKFMPKIAKVANILGPAGVMPNPKSGTVTDKIEETVDKYKHGQIEIRTEPSAPIIHTMVGKINWESEKLEENILALLTSLRQNRPIKAKPSFIKSAFLKTTMGKSIELEI